jgi:hypothetical protein
MEFKELYEMLLHETKLCPNVYEYTEIISQKIKSKDFTLEYSNTVFSFIIYHNIKKIMEKNNHISKEDMIKFIINKTGRKSNIYSVCYGGKTFDGGNGLTYVDIDDTQKFPIDLKKIIVAYVNMVTY